MHLPPEPREALFRRLADGVAPGGTLLIVGHHPSDLQPSVARGALPELRYTASEVAALLGRGEWEILVEAAPERSVTDPAGEPVTIHDAVYGPPARMTFGCNRAVDTERPGLAQRGAEATARRSSVRQHRMTKEGSAVLQEILEHRSARSAFIQMPSDQAGAAGGSNSLQGGDGGCKISETACKSPGRPLSPRQYCDGGARKLATVQQQTPSSGDQAPCGGPDARRGSAPIDRRPRGWWHGHHSWLAVLRRPLASRAVEGETHGQLACAHVEVVAAEHAQLAGSWPDVTKRDDHRRCLWTVVIVHAFSDRRESWISASVSASMSLRPLGVSKRSCEKGFCSTRPSRRASPNKERATRVVQRGHAAAIFRASGRSTEGSPR